MEEYQKKSQNNNTTRSFSPLTNRRRLSAPVISTRTRSVSLRSSYSDAIPSSSLPGGETRRRRQSLLETKGETETRVSISDGTSHSVKCQGCNRRLLAPMNYSLVFCPKCRIVSPVWSQFTSRKNKNVSPLFTMFLTENKTTTDPTHFVVIHTYIYIYIYIYRLHNIKLLTRLHSISDILQFILH